MRSILLIPVLWAICSVPADCGPLPSVPPPASAEKPAALVNGEAISLADLKAALDARPSPVPLSAAQQKELRQGALDMLIDDLVMRQFLRKHGTIEPEAIDRELEDLKVVLGKQGKTIGQYLREEKQTEANLRADAAARLQWKAYLRTHYPEPEVKSYYEANKLHFDKVQVRASHILIKVAASATPLDKGQARAKLETIRQEILTGKIDFNEAARRYSECPTGEKGGDVGLFFYKGDAIEPFTKAAFALKVGDVSEVFGSEAGLHILKVTERTKGEASTFEGCRDQVRDVMAQDQELYPHVLAEQRKAAKIETFLP
jgi:parvulin-like peptidyl-prolyl isomerase